CRARRCRTQRRGVRLPKDWIPWTCRPRSERVGACLRDTEQTGCHAPCSGSVPQLPGMFEHAAARGGRPAPRGLLDWRESSSQEGRGRTAKNLRPLTSERDQRATTTAAGSTRSRVWRPTPRLQHGLSPPHKTSPRSWSMLPAEEDSMNVGFIGLGLMGGSMALNLQAAGHSLCVHDLRRDSAAAHLAKGAVWKDSPRALAEACDVIFTSLPGPPEVSAVAAGADGLIHGMRRGAALFDLSTNSPAVIRRLHAQF